MKLIIVTDYSKTLMSKNANAFSYMCRQFWWSEICNCIFHAKHFVLVTGNPRSLRSHV